MAQGIAFNISYRGEEADDFSLDFYDAAQAMIGFQRSLALTTHLVLNGEIITQAPALKGAKILVSPAIEGSWRANAYVLIAGLYAAGQVPKDTPIGHLIASAYDYAIYKTIGVHVDYEKSLTQLYEEAHKENPKIIQPKPEKYDSLIEKIEPAIRQIHRPIVNSETAELVEINSFKRDGEIISSVTLDKETYEGISVVYEGPQRQLQGYVSSYNVNTHKGRIFIPDERRTIPFSLSYDIINLRSVREVTRSLRANALSEDGVDKVIKFRAIQFFGSNERLKSLYITEISSN